MNPPGEPIIPQSPHRKVGNSTYISVPGPVPVIEAGRLHPLLDDSTRCPHVMIRTPLVLCGLTAEHRGDHVGHGIHNRPIREGRGDDDSCSCCRPVT